MMDCKTSIYESASQGRLGIRQIKLVSGPFLNSQGGLTHARSCSNSSPKWEMHKGEQAGSILMYRRRAFICRTPHSHSRQYKCKCVLNSHPVRNEPYSGSGTGSIDTKCIDVTSSVTSKASWHAPPRGSCSKEIDIFLTNNYSALASCREAYLKGGGGWHNYGEGTSNPAQPSKKNWTCKPDSREIRSTCFPKGENDTKAFGKQCRRTESRNQGIPGSDSSNRINAVWRLVPVFASTRFKWNRAVSRVVPRRSAASRTSDP